MNCDLAGSLIDDYLEDRLGQRERHQVEKHLARCSHCAEEVRRRPAFERDLRRALASSVHFLYLSADARTRILQAAEQSLHQAKRSRRVSLAFQLVAAATAAMLLMVGLFALLGQIPVPSGLKPTLLFPQRNLLLPEPEPVTISSGGQPMPQLAAAADALPRASLVIEPREMVPRDSFTMTVWLESDLLESLETVQLDLEITGPTGFYLFGLAVSSPLPAHGVSIFEVTSESLAEACQEQYLISPVDIFSVPGVYTFRVTLLYPVPVSQ
jgi:hypothetical protein